MALDDFARALSAGSSAHLHFGSLVSEFSISAQELRECDLDLAAWELANARQLATGLPETYSALSINSKHFLARHAHEQDHLNRLIGTTFGLLCDDLHARWITGCVHLIRERVRRDQSPLFPLLRTAKTNSLNFEASAEIGSLGK